jgi:hypothetical protein
MFKADKNADVNGTSYHGISVSATVNQLTEAFGQPHFEGCEDDKVTYEWLFSNDDGDVFTVYDWKHYYLISEDSYIDWHIGSKTPELEESLKEFIKKVLDKSGSQL